MTIQEIFTKVVTHLLTQNCQAMDDGGCVYRSQNHNLKCAVGSLITSKVYASYAIDREDRQEDGECNRLEGESMRSYLVKEAVGTSIGRELTMNEVSLLEALQQTHDGFGPSHWKPKFVKIAHTYGLEIAT